jgi:hypothetical protein
MHALKARRNKPADRQSRLRRLHPPSKSTILPPLPLLPAACALFLSLLAPLSLFGARATDDGEIGAQPRVTYVRARTRAHVT